MLEASSTCRRRSYRQLPRERRILSFPEDAFNVGSEIIEPPFDTTRSTPEELSSIFQRSRILSSNLSQIMHRSKSLSGYDSSKPEEVIVGENVPLRECSSHAIAELLQDLSNGLDDDGSEGDENIMVHSFEEDRSDEEAASGHQIPVAPAITSVPSTSTEFS
ncbi:hypothetical protein AAG570_005135 [Ranatra chinensis]|uniref:Uncharacterized protein n=1 Tax=Ranatra chinensis TaxID=642074 RepID=A0ABD0XZW4_9HEMI